MKPSSSLASRETALAADASVWVADFAAKAGVAELQAVMLA
ncbi:hypothetical protein [Defluviicoccus vanus]|nr:hypothetical protein [Defluviicoccus vanus]